MLKIHVKIRSWWHRLFFALPAYFSRPLPVAGSSPVSLAEEIARAEAFVVNTCNEGKLLEFKDFLLRPITSQGHDLEEPDSDPRTVIRFKASQFSDVLVDDTSLEVVGEDIGVNVRWLLDSLGKFAGKKALFRCLIGIAHGGKVLIYEGKISGTLVEPRGRSFGFNAIFLPDGAQKTLGEDRPPKYNARYIAVQKLLRAEPDAILDLLPSWSGPFQRQQP